MQLQSVTASASLFACPVQQQVMVFSFWFGPLRALMRYNDGGENAHRFCQLIFETVDRLVDTPPEQAHSCHELLHQLVLVIILEPVNEGNLLRVRRQVRWLALLLRGLAAQVAWLCVW